MRHIALLGFGEVGQRLAADLAAGNGFSLSAYDILFDDATSKPSVALEAMRFVRGGRSPTDAVRQSDLVISAVTASEDLEATRSVLDELRPKAYYLDLNSVSPATRRAAAELIEAAGCRYLEGAIMSAIAPLGIASPLLLGGPHARGALSGLRDLGFSGATHFASEIGLASAAKMCRSVLIKGLEALLLESLLAARHYGVEQDVLGSLHDPFPAADWSERARYMIARSLEHGTRRAEEMHEVAETLEQAGVEPLMSLACADRQAWAARHAPALSEQDLATLLDEIGRPHSRSGAAQGEG